MHNPAPVLENSTHKLLWDLDIQTDQLIFARIPHLIIINKKKKRICEIVDFAVPADHRIKLKECEKKDKYLDLARELKKKNFWTWRWQLWLVLLVQQLKDYRRNWRTWNLANERRPSKLQDYWERPEYWQKSRRLQETYSHSNSNEGPSGKVDVKNYQGVNINNRK